MIEVLETKLDGVKMVHLEFFEDHRGQYVETYNEELYAKFGIRIKFVQDDYSRSTKHVLRGLHGDNHTWKLISCLFGKFMLAVVNCDPKSNQYCQWETFILSDENKTQVLIPPSFANGHLVLSDVAIFHYKQSSYYSADDQFSFRYDDERFNIWWPIKNPILSQRDESGAYV